MNAPAKIALDEIDFTACQHWSTEMPYRAVVAVSANLTHGTILYQVAGTSEPPRKAINALRLALEKFGGKCHYCKTSIAEMVKADLTIDHIEALAHGGRSDLSNLVIACRPCNAAKGHMPIDAFNPSATREWLEALRKQIDGRLENLPPK